ncbi:hypothetical protein FWK35_00000038 [Aphis craccivora]|uniref:Uncharacterized protein n=1 Tax=Aphis craccivora TaxID=307492 RepID=A0A6G0ZQY5_APHCR|nr:hypothetical protein FWK35_00000038 [Aphis craccivora]
MSHTKVVAINHDSMFGPVESHFSWKKVMVKLHSDKKKVVVELHLG